MTVQTVSLGTTPWPGDANWEGAILLSRAFVDGTETAYIRVVGYGFNTLILRLAETATANPLDPGPSLSSALASRQDAFTFAEAGGSSVTMPGPTNPDNLFSDSSEPYQWNSGSDAVDAFNDWIRFLGNGEVTLTLDDGLESVSATLTGATGSVAVSLRKTAVVGATLTGAAGSVAVSLRKTEAIRATLAGAAGSLAVALKKLTVGATFAGADGSVEAALTKTTVGTQPVAATNAGVAGTASAAVTVRAHVPGTPLPTVVTFRPTITRHVSPHLSHPLRLIGTGFAAVEQDSIQEVRECVETLVRTVIGQRVERPAYGISPPELTQDGIDEAELASAIEQWEERATEYELEGGEPLLDELASTYRLQLTSDA